MIFKIAIGRLHWVANYKINVDINALLDYFQIILLE